MTRRTVLLPVAAFSASLPIQQQEDTHSLRPGLRRQGFVSKVLRTGDRLGYLHGAMKRIAIVLALFIGATLLGAPPSAVGYRGERVYIANNRYFPERVYRPRNFGITGDGTFGIKRVTWSTYNGAVARGRGTAVTTDCDPDCADGRRISNKITFALSSVRRRCGRLHGLQAFVLPPYHLCEHHSGRAV